MDPFASRNMEPARQHPEVVTEYLQKAALWSIPELRRWQRKLHKQARDVTSKGGYRGGVPSSSSPPSG